MTFQDVEAARSVYHQKRKRIWTIIGIIAGILIGIFVLVMILSKSFSSIARLDIVFPPFIVFPFSILIIGFVISTTTTRTLADNYRRAYKAYFVEKNLQAVFTDLSYSHEKGIDPKFLAATGMINTGDVYNSNDYTTGRYKNVLFTQADVNISVEQTDSDGDTTYVTIFFGRFMIFEFPKKFNFKLEIVGKKFYAYRKPGKNSTTGRKMQKISTESNEFNDSFRIFGEDGFEAYYILDPAFMVKMMNINARYDGKIFFGFVDNHLIIGLNDGKDSFEPPKKISQPIDEAKENQKISSDIKVITDFVDQLSLSRGLFKQD